jgi:hypothetical protein
MSHDSHRLDRAWFFHNHTSLFLHLPQANTARCAGDNKCFTTSPIFTSGDFAGPISQCSTDSQCPTYSPNIGTNPTAFCCDEVAAFFNYWCLGTPMTAEMAASQTVVQCAQRPDCVPQRFPYLTIQTTTAQPGQPTTTALPGPPTTPTPANLQVRRALCCPGLGL